MFRLVRFSFRTIVTLKLMLIAFAAGVGTAVGLQLRMQYRSWGLVEGADGRDLAGDELVSAPEAVETRAIDIDVPPARVWPWLLQLGYGRGGWYGYPLLDRPWSSLGGATRHSADSILEEHQDLDEGDLVPIGPQGGFVVRGIEPGRSLVLYLDDTLLREQMAELAEEAGEDAEELVAEMRGEMPPFRLSWSFVLEEAPGDRSRLVERLRFHVEGLTDAQRRAMPLLSLGAFTLLRSQLLGIKRRAESAPAVVD